MLRCACVVWLIVGVAAIDCPRDSGHGTWKKAPSGDRCFLLSNEGGHTFRECQVDVCGPAGGTLACVRDEDSSWLIETYFSTDEAYGWFGERGV